MPIRLEILKRFAPYSISERENRLESALATSFASVLQSPKSELAYRIQSNNDLIQKVRLNFLLAIVFKVSNFVIKLFNKRYAGLDKVLTFHELGGSLQGKYIEILNASKIQNISIDILRYKKSAHLPIHIKLGVYSVQKFQYQFYQDELDRLGKHLRKRDIGTALEQKQMFESMPQLIQNQILLCAGQRGLSNWQVENDLKRLIRTDATYKTSILNELKKGYQAHIRECDALIQQTYEELAAPPSSRIIDPTKDRYVYQASTDLLTQRINARFLKQPIKVVMAGVEYLGLIKEGGLAEALAGLSRGLAQQNAKNEVTLVFPKVSTLVEKLTNDKAPAEMIHALTHPESTHVSAEGVTYKIYSYKKDGVVCKFVEHEAFILPPGHESMYGPNEFSQSERFAAFSKLAADYISVALDPDIVHVHDWHAAGVGLELKKKAQALQEEGAEGQRPQKKTPAVVFTYHNNARMAQGRVGGGGYNYQGLASAYAKWGIINDNQNLFVEMIRAADAVTTVSPTFAEESQDIQGDAQGVSFAVRDAAREGKLFGILNGANPSDWNPRKQDGELSRWRDIDSGEPIDLSYGPDHQNEFHKNVIEQKARAKVQLQKWVKKFQPDLNIDFSKPIVTFIGRFDSYQKGLDKLEEAIDATLKNGGQFICMGVGDHPKARGSKIQDPKAKEILDRLQKKYTKGVFWVRDYKVTEGRDKGRLYYQNGTVEAQERPGMGLLARAASDFVFIPSSFEPCGLVQFEGWLFGSLAIGSKVGGLVDTIITREHNQEQFNGFLFSRDSAADDSCSATIKNALKFWKEQRVESKKDLLERVMVTARKSGWNSRVNKHTYSRIEQYRYVYELTKIKAKAGRAASRIFTPEDAVQRLKVLPNKPISAQAAAEETYMVNYAHAAETGIFSEELESLYLKLPKGLRLQYPAPYGINVHHTKYVEYGAHYTPESTRFSVHAPNAQSVNLVLVNNQEQVIREVTMHKEASSGDWKIQIPALQPGQRYQYKINNTIKIDPYSRQILPSSDYKNPPYSVVVNSQHKWTDQVWMKERAAKKGHDRGMSIYELHLTTWKKKNGANMNYRELAHDLVEHVKKSGFTHVELMGLLEHPYEPSWGYQVTGYFAPNSRLGSVDDLKYLINYLHQNKVGVILDWVPGHFASDAYNLGKFDGSHMFEPSPWNLRHIFSFRKLFQNFGSHFDYGKQGVREFLISSAHFWLKEMHIDGLRVDCVAGMLHSDNPAKSQLFLKDLNAIVHHKHEGAITIAEDYSGSANTLNRFHHQDGLGFDLKWNVGWLHEMMKYFGYPVNKRKSRYDIIRSALNQPNSEHQVVYVSHDEFKKAGQFLNLFNKQSAQERHANWKAILSLLMTSQGKKLMFSGMEMENTTHWDTWIDRPTVLMNEHANIGEMKRQTLALTTALNELYKTEPALHATQTGAEVDWIEDSSKTIHAYRTKAQGSSIAVIHNFTHEDVREFKVTVPKKEGEHLTPIEIFSSDDSEFGGNSQLNQMVTITQDSPSQTTYSVQVPPLTTLLVKER